MRVYEPRKDAAYLKDALKELWVLREALKHKGKLDSLVEIADRARDKIKDALDIIEEES